MAGPPSPKRIFDAVEGVVGDALERAVQTGPFARSSRTVMNLETHVRKATERASRRLWHALNLPAGSDVRRLESQLSRLERTVEGRKDAAEPGQLIQPDDD